MPLLGMPLLLTTTLPLVAVVGTMATMLLLDQLEVVVAWPLNVTMPVLAPKLHPEIVIAVPGDAVVALKPVMTRGMVNWSPLLATPDTVTTTFPVDAAAGTATLIEPEYHLLTVAGAPLKVTVLLPCNGPKPLPATVTRVPTVPEAGVIAVIVGTDAPIVTALVPQIVPAQAVTVAGPAVR